MKQKQKLRFGVSGQANPLKRPTQDKTQSPARKSFSQKPKQKGFSNLSENAWRAPKQEKKQLHLVSGSIKRHPDGYGFLIPDDPGLPDVYVGKNSMAGVMTNDKIEVRIQKEGDRFRGELSRIISRETKLICGLLEKRGPFNGLIRDASHAWGDDLHVTIPKEISLKNDDWVQVKILSYPDHIRGFQGEVVAVIGDISDAKNDNIRILTSSGIPAVFSAAAVQEARKIPQQVLDHERKGRVDLRSKNFITIDGQTAKDFDDAIYVEKSARGFKLWVGIADVSHYVRPGTAIDKDAYERGTSTYFPHFVAPMLPEALSNEICSLKPNVDRLSLVCEMDINFQGELLNSKFYEAVINSKSRVTYGEAQQIIDGGVVEKHSPVASNIRLASELSNILMTRRFANGSLNLEVPETTIEVDDSGVPIDILRSERLFAHRLIEEMMLIANVATAQFLDKNGVPALYRVHDAPKEDAIQTLESYLDNFGYKKGLNYRQLQKSLTHALEYFSGQPQEIILNILTLRSMMQAKYSPDNRGHFGLGFSHYAHFTSPIRRYPDLIIHRLIKSVILSNKGYGRLSNEDLETAGSILSACEQRSVKAERQIISIKKARFIQKHLGEEFDGIISSVTRFGVFVLLRQFDVDGLVKVEELGERLEFDEDHLRLYERRSGRGYEIGDALRVQVAAVDIQNGRIDFVLSSGDERSHANVSTQAKKSKHTQERRKAQDNSEHIREARVSRPGRKNKAKPSRHSHRKDSRKNNRKNRNR